MSQSYPRVKFQLTRSKLLLPSLLIPLALVGAGCTTTNQRATPNRSITSNFQVSPQKSSTTPLDMVNWWRQFGDPVLVNFVDHGLKENIDIAIAIEKVNQSRSMVDRSKANRAPTVDVDTSLSRQRRSLLDPQSSAPPNVSRNSTSYKVESQLGWEWDLFGRRDFADNSAVSLAEASEADRQAMRLIVVSDIARNTLIIRSLQKRIALAEEGANLDYELIDITRAKQRGGQVTETEVQRALALYQSSAAALAKLHSDETVTIEALAILTGLTPEDVRQKLAQKSYPITMPAIDVTLLPASLLERRPDLQRAFFQWRAAVNDTDGVKAERFPHLTFGTGLGWIAGSLSGIGSASALAASISPSMSWRIFDFGRLDADIASAQSNEAQALLRYKKAAITAFAEADTALSDLVWREQAIKATSAASAAQRTAWQLSNLQYQRGLIDFASVLDIKRQLTQVQDNEALAVQAQWLAAVAVYSSLGGGWPAGQ